MGVASGCGEQEVGVASGSGWNLWVWLLGVVLRRYIDFLILLIPTPLVSVLFCSSIPTFLFIFLNVFIYLYMNNHIYSTLFKTQEREPDRRSKEIEQRKESQNTHTNKTTRTCDPKYRTTIYCIKFPSNLNGLGKKI